MAAVNIRFGSVGSTVIVPSVWLSRTPVRFRFCPTVRVAGTSGPSRASSGGTRRIVRRVPVYIMVAPPMGRSRHGPVRLRGSPRGGRRSTIRRGIGRAADGATGLPAGGGETRRPGAPGGRPGDVRSRTLKTWAVDAAAGPGGGRVLRPD